MTLSIYTQSPSQPDFEFDITTDVQKSLRWNPTKRAVENTGNVADHVYREPFTISSNGFVAVTPISPRSWQPTPSTDESVLIDMQKALEDLANRRDLVILVSDVYTGPVAITSLTFAKSVDDGHSLRVDISFSEIEIAVPFTTSISSSRLKPKKMKGKVKRRADTVGGIKASEQKQLAAARKALGIKASTLSRAAN